MKTKMTMKEYGMVAAVLCAVAVGFGGEVSFPLEWSARYDTSVPYEVEINAEKLEKFAGVPRGSGFAVTATTPSGMRRLDVAAYEGRFAGDVGLRFKVPSGTTALSCTVGVGRLRIERRADGDLLADACADPSGWVCETGATVEAAGGGLLFRASKPATRLSVSRTVALPRGMAGKGAAFEIELENVGKMVWANPIRLLQLDANGKQLNESVVDPRWTSHMRPVGRTCTLRERGRFHPDATRIRLELKLVSLTSPVDAHGLPLEDADALLAKLKVTRLSLRVAEELPFPRYDDRFFAEGLSGEPGDTALRLGDDRAFWYQTHSQACWAEDRQISNPQELFYPDGPGTIEAWFKPAWKRDDARPFVLFQGSHRNGKSQRTKKGPILQLNYVPAKGEFLLSMIGMDGKAVSGSGAGALEPGQWSHVALQWSDSRAEIFLNGRCVADVALDGYLPWKLATTSPNYPENERLATECFLGSTYERARRDPKPYALEPFFDGAVDNWRVSSGRRYNGPFTPQKAFVPDPRTRALFTFDRSFDGISGGGLRFIPGTTRADTSRRQQTVNAAPTPFRYFPESILPGFNPTNVFNLLNYPVLPSVSDFRSSRRRIVRPFDLTPGGTFEVECPEHAVADYIEIANTGRSPLLYPVVFNEGELDPRSFGDLADTLALGGFDDRGKVDRLFQFVLGASDYFMNHTVTFYGGSDVPDKVERNAMRMLNGYCGFECGPLNNMTANLFACVAGCPASQTGGYGHSFEQVFFDGKNHIYDLSAQKFFPAWDNSSAASLGEAENEPGIFARLGGSCDHFIRIATRTWEAQTPAYQEKIGVILRPGERCRLWFSNNGQQNDVQTYNPKTDPIAGSFWHEDYAAQTGAKASATWSVCRVNRFMPEAANGFVTFDGRPSAENPAFEVGRDSFCYAVKVGYPIVWASYSAELKDGRKAAIELSTDRGSSFRPLVCPATYPVRGRQEYLVRVKAPIGAVTRFRAVTEIQMNRRVMTGKLHPGRNRLSFKSARPAAGSSARVAVSWRERAKPIEVVGGVHTGAMPGHERQTFLIDPARPLALPVKGASASARAVAHGPVKAVLSDGVLRVSAVDSAARPGFAAVDIIDGGAVKQITFVVCANARLVLAPEAVLSGGAKLGGVSEDRIQPCVLLSGAKDRARFQFDPLPAGKYVILEVDRYESHTRVYETFHRHSQYLRLTSPEDGSEVPAGGPRNGGSNYYKAWFGKRGERTNFKWSYPLDPRSKYITWIMRRFDCPAFDHLDYWLWQERPEGVEVAAVLVLPAPDEDFYCELLKVLCGLNCEPWMVSAE